MLEMNQVVKTFGKFKALDRLTMQVPKGSVYGLVGPNGAGKSTAIRILTGTFRQDSGTVQMEGKDIYENPETKKRICMIPDDIFYFPSSTMEEMSRFYESMYASFDRALYERMKDIFQLPEKGQIRRFSKGMQKQAAFRLAVACRPDVLILDEPVDGLDPVMRRQIWSIILGDVSQNETTVLISSHNLRELEDVCDHVGIMNRGRMLLEKSLADMQGNTVKLQLVGELPQGLEVLHHSCSGRLNTYVIRGSAEMVTQRVEAEAPVYFDVLPLSLEEIFIYELGGADYEIKDLVL